MAKQSKIKISYTVSRTSHFMSHLFGDMVEARQEVRKKYPNIGIYDIGGNNETWHNIEIYGENEAEVKNAATIFFERVGIPRLVHNSYGIGERLFGKGKDPYRLTEEVLEEFGQILERRGSVEGTAVLWSAKELIPGKKEVVPA